MAGGAHAQPLFDRRIDIADLRLAMGVSSCCMLSHYTKC